MLMGKTAQFRHLGWILSSTGILCFTFHRRAGAPLLTRIQDASEWRVL